MKVWSDETVRICHGNGDGRNKRKTEKEEEDIVGGNHKWYNHNMWCLWRCEDRYMREFRNRASNPTVYGLTGGAEWKSTHYPNSKLSGNV